MKLDLAKLLLRLGAGGLMIPHGYGKLMRLIENGWDTGFADPLGIGQLPSLVLVIFAELICPILIILGYKTRLSVIPPAITMLVAILFIHLSDPWGDKELPMLYLTAYISLGLAGAGRYAIDRS